MSEDQAVLVVVSKIKKYISETGNCNTAGDVADALSEEVRKLLDSAIAKAKAEGRKTVMKRDISG